MSKRKQNPSLAASPGYVPRKKKRKRRPKPKAEFTKAEREAAIQKANYIERTKRMRGLFGDQFKAKDGYDLRKINSWTPAQKAKVTRYFRVIAPRITGDFVVRRYRIKENFDAALSASLQEKPLKGQTAVAFSVDPGEKLEVKVKKGRAKVVRDGFQNVKLQFDKNALIEDPDREIDRILALTNANVFRVLTGAFKQNKTLTRSNVRDELVRLIRYYDPSNIERDQGQRPFDEWLNGLIAYEGSEEKTFRGVDKFVQRHIKRMKQRERDRLDDLSAKKKGMTRAQYRRYRTIMRKKRAAKKKAKKRGKGK